MAEQRQRYVEIANAELAMAEQHQRDAVIAKTLTPEAFMWLKELRYTHDEDVVVALENRVIDVARDIDLLERKAAQANADLASQVIGDTIPVNHNAPEPAPGLWEWLWNIVWGRGN